MRSPALQRCLAAWALLAAVAACAVGAGEPRDELTRPIEIEVDKAATIAVERGGEALRMKWKLAGFLGALAGLFVPNSGDALLTFVPGSEDRMEIQLLVTAPKRKGEFFLYGAQIDETSGSTTAVWNAWAFRDKSSEKEQDIEGAEQVIDYSSAIYHMRWNPPETTIRMTIWSHGEIYPVEVQPLEPSRRKITGKKIDVRGYSVRGIKKEGQSTFDDNLTLYFADDEQATPVEFVGKRGLVKVRIQLVDSAGHSHSADPASASSPRDGGESGRDSAGR